MTPFRIPKAIAWRLERLRDVLEQRRKTFVVVNYHRLYAHALETLFDERVYGDISQEYFRRQLRWLRGNAQVLSQSELRGCLQKPHTFPKRGVLLTFDDGYRDNYDLAFPALQDEGLSALFFVPTQALETRRLGWWDIIAYLVKRTDKPALELEGVVHPLTGEDDRRILIDLLQERFKKLPEFQTKHLLEELGGKLETPFPSFESQDAELMTVAHLREMIRAGMGIGAHTHSHRVLSTLTRDEQAREIAKGKHVLEAWLGESVYSLAYPVGRRDSFDDVTKCLAKDAGFEMAFSFYSGFNRPSRMDPMDLKRSYKRKPFEDFSTSILYPWRILQQ